jgi:hypothetical protein
LALLTEKLMQTAHPFILETNFSTQFESRLGQLAKHYGYTPLVFHLSVPGGVLADRFRVRSLSGARHPGHQDGETLDQWLLHLREKAFLPPTRLGEHVVAVDASEPWSPASVAAVIVKIDDLRAALGSPTPDAK